MLRGWCGSRNAADWCIIGRGGVAVLNYESLLADASLLPVADRIQLIEALWETVPTESLPPLTKEWHEEVKRRSAEYESGSVQTVPWEQIRADALCRVGATESNAAR